MIMGLLFYFTINNQAPEAFCAMNRTQIDKGNNNIITDNKISSKTVADMPKSYRHYLIITLDTHKALRYLL